MSLAHLRGEGDRRGGQPSTTRTSTWTVDTTAPTVTIDTKPSAPSNTPTPTFGFSSTAVATFECSLDGRLAPAAPRPLADDRGSGLAHLRGEGDRRGGHTRPTRTYTWSVDTVQPTATIGTKPAVVFQRHDAGLRVHLERAVGRDVRVLDRRRVGYAACATPHDARDRSRRRRTPSTSRRSTWRRTTRRQPPRSPGRSIRHRPTVPGSFQLVGAGIDAATRRRPSSFHAVDRCARRSRTGSCAAATMRAPADHVRRVPVHDRLDDHRRRHRRRRLPLHRHGDRRCRQPAPRPAEIVVTIDGGPPSVPGEPPRHRGAHRNGSRDLVERLDRPARDLPRVPRRCHHRHRQRAGDHVQRRDAAARRNRGRRLHLHGLGRRLRPATRALRARGARSCSTRMRPLPAARADGRPEPDAGEARAGLAGLREQRSRRLQRLPRRREAQRRARHDHDLHRLRPRRRRLLRLHRARRRQRRQRVGRLRCAPACSTTRPLRAPPAPRPWRLRAAVRPRSAGRLQATPVRGSPPTRCVALPRTVAPPSTPRRGHPDLRDRSADLARLRRLRAWPRVRATATPCSRSTRSATSPCRVRRRRSRSRARPTRRPRRRRPRCARCSRTDRSR